MLNRNFIVGLFVTAALVTFVFTTIWLTGRNSSGHTLEYSLNFDKGVSGLMLGGPVYYLGVEVGTVTAMTIVPGDPAQVRVDIEILASTPIDAGTWATLALQGITGVAVIKLSGTPGKHEPLQRRKGRDRPVIEVRDTGFAALMSKAPQIIDRLDDVLEQMAQLMNEENRSRISATLDDIASVSGALSAKREEIGRLPADIDATLKEFRDTLAQLRTATDRTGPEIETILENMNRATANLDKLTQRMESWSAVSGDDVGAFLEDGLGQVPALVADARAALREVEKLVQDLRADPSKLIYQPARENIDSE